MPNMKQEITQAIRDYLSNSNRYRIVILQSPDLLPDENIIWNVGRQLADFLKDNKESSTLSEEFADKCKSLALEHVTHIDDIDKCLFIANFGVLFEPLLQFDANSFIRKLSQNNTVILCSNTLLTNDKLYISQAESPYYIDLQDINYLAL